MFGKLFKARLKAAPMRAAATPDDTVVWAVGDVHGRLDLLEPLTDAMIEDLIRSPARRKVIVFLGDYIDRGPDSKGVIDLLCAIRAESLVETHFIRGNHEARLEAFLTDPTTGADWCDYGGREALRSYGVLAPMLKTDAAGWTVASEALNNALNEQQRAFFRNLEYSLCIGGYFFAHAGAMPGVALDRQDPHQLMWIRQPFLDHPAPFERVVVHGHTPSEAVHSDHRRIGLDTKAYASGILTGVRLEGENRELMQTAGARSNVSISRRPL